MKNKVSISDETNIKTIEHKSKKNINVDRCNNWYN